MGTTLSTLLEPGEPRLSSPKVSDGRAPRSAVTSRDHPTFNTTSKDSKIPDNSADEQSDKQPGPDGMAAFPRHPALPADMAFAKVLYDAFQNMVGKGETPDIKHAVIHGCPDLGKEALARDASQLTPGKRSCAAFVLLTIEVLKGDMSGYDLIDGKPATRLREFVAAPSPTGAILNRAADPAAAAVFKLPAYPMGPIDSTTIRQAVPPSFPRPTRPSLSCSTTLTAAFAAFTTLRSTSATSPRLPPPPPTL